VIGTGGLTREEALSTLHDLETNPMKWLGEPKHRALRGWLREVGITAVAGESPDPRH
jgi:hypothetical protein